MTTTSERSAQPVTVMFTWDVEPGREAAFESWAHGVNDTASAYPGHLGATWLRAEGSRHRYYTILNFSDENRLNTWMDSDEREEWLRRVDGIATEHRHRTTGMETWFSLPDRSVHAPPRWKMALVTFAGVYPLSLILQVTAVPVAKAWPLPLRGLVFPAILVPLLTYLIMPGLSRLLRRWLYPGQ
jgi:antibiotic biosynthesis monooxygenase (ABM) superfamily enzyme